MLGGFSRLGLGLADFTAETVDTFGKTVVDGDILPSSTGGLIGAMIDKKNGASAVDPNIGPGTSRFGNKFYVAGDKVTSLKEATNPGVMLRFSMSNNAKLLDLTNPAIASSMGYEMGMSHEAVQQLMKNWDLTGYDAIKFPSEKNPGGVNYGVINPTILTFEGIEGL